MTNRDRYAVFLRRSCISPREPIGTYEGAVEFVHRMARMAKVNGFGASTWTITRNGDPIRTITV